jgi:hypothetical protein
MWTGAAGCAGSAAAADVAVNRTADLLAFAPASEAIMVILYDDYLPGALLTLHTKILLLLLLLLQRRLRTSCRIP